MQSVSSRIWTRVAVSITPLTVRLQSRAFGDRGSFDSTCLSYLWVKQKIQLFSDGGDNIYNIYIVAAAATWNDAAE